MLELLYIISSIIKLATYSTFYFRKQIYHRGNKCLIDIINTISENYSLLNECYTSDLSEALGLHDIMIAQKNDDYILIADIIELRLIPVIEEIANLIMSCFVEQEVNYSNRISGHDLDRFKKGLYETVFHSEPITDCIYETECTNIAGVTIVLEERGYRYYYSGNNNPYMDALNFLNSDISYEGCDYFIYGAGMLYEAEVILDTRPASEVYVYESDMYIIKLLLKYRNVKHILDNERFHLIIGESGQILDYLDNDRFRLLFRMSSIRHTHDENIRNAIEKYCVKQSSVEYAYNYMLANFYRNIKRRNDWEPIDIIRDRIEDKKVFLIAGGPSLDGTIDYIKSNRESGIIVAVGATAKKLNKNGITADFIVETDPFDRDIRHIIDNIDIKNTGLIFLSTVWYKMLDFSGKKYAAFHEGFDHSVEYANNNGFNIVTGGGSVATVALDICLRFKAKEITCFGLDLAYTNNQSHASGVKNMPTVTNSSNIIRVKGVKGNMVPTVFNMLTYKEWIENRLRDVTDVKITNVSDGAYIEGMRNLAVDSINLI